MDKKDKSGKNNPAWKGGIRYALGYRFLLRHNHPNANDKGYVQEHRLVMEDYLGRYLTSTERVHHINNDKLDNRIENLYLFSTQSDHIKHHIKDGSINIFYWKGKKRKKETREKMSKTHKKLWKLYGRKQKS